MAGGPSTGLRIAALVKQIPAFETMALGPDGRLVRDGIELEMNAYCRRAVSKGVELAAATRGTCTVVTLGPPAAEDCLREALAWGADDAVLVSDPAFAGSDTLATARALAAVLGHEGPFDLVLLGRNSVDADTGQVPPQVAELLGLPFLTGVRELELAGRTVRAGCERDDEWLDAELELPAVLSCAERLCEPSKMPVEARARVSTDRIRTLCAADLGPGPWGQAGSPTSVGTTRLVEVARDRRVLSGSVSEQVDEAVRLLVESGTLDGGPDDTPAEPVRASGGAGPVVGVLVEPGRARATRELLGEAAVMADRLGGSVTAVGSSSTGGTPVAAELSTWGADRLVTIGDGGVEEDVAAATAAWAGAEQPWALLAPGTAWGREVAARIAARLGAGLTGDAVGLEVADGRLVAWKPAFGGRTLAAITCSSPVQMATVRPGVLGLRAPRPPTPLAEVDAPVDAVSRVRVTERRREDDVDLLANADRVIAVGLGVPPDSYDVVRSLAAACGAELAATRKVTDQGWMPRARQVGITGHAVAPALFIAIGASGRFNFIVGATSAGTILAVNPDPDALIWDWCDIGIVASWEEAVPLLTEALAAAVRPTVAS